MNDIVKTQVRTDPPERREQGIPIPKHDVVAADLLALVAGINFHSAVKFLLALNAIAEGLSIPLHILAAQCAIPTEPAGPSRYKMTGDVADKLAKAPGIKQYEPELHFLHRMSRK